MISMNYLSMLLLLLTSGSADIPSSEIPLSSTGRWQLEEISDANSDDAFTGMGPAQTIEFRDDGELGAYDGCNGLTTSYQLGEERSLTIGPGITSTLVYCEGLNQNLGQYLIDITSYELKDDDTLVLKGDGFELLFSPAE